MKKQCKRINRFFGFFLCVLCLTSGTLFPTAPAVDAEEMSSSGNEKTIHLMDPGRTSEGIRAGDHIWFGTKDDENYYWAEEAPYWRVLDADRMNNGESGMFLVSESLLANRKEGGAERTQFDVYPRNSGVWQGSVAQEWCRQFFANVFSEPEQAAIAATCKSDAEYAHVNEGQEWSWYYKQYDNILNGDKVFFLSAEEAASSAYGLGSNAARKAYYKGKVEEWWLRSKYGTKNVTNPDMAGTIGGTINSVVESAIETEGALSYDIVHLAHYMRPAFNVDLSSVLFSTKVSAEPDTYKLTVKDPNLGVTVTGDIRMEDGTITAPCTVCGAHANVQTKMIVLITDKSYTDSTANVLYYGVAAEDGTIPLDDENRYVYLLAENRNGEKETDYASEPLQIYPERKEPEEPEKPVLPDPGRKTETQDVVKTGELVKNAGGSAGQEVRVIAPATEKTAGTVTYTKAPDKKSITVPQTVKIGKRTYLVTQVAPDAFRGKRIRSVTIGANIKKISRYAFRKSKAKILIIRSKKLTKKNVRGCLKNSGITTIRVRVGSKAFNKKYIKKYRKVFTKKVVGKKVRIK